MAGSPEDRKKTIARATCRAIVELGLHRMNMRDIARALGTTTGPLQHYFAQQGGSAPIYEEPPHR